MRTSWPSRSGSPARISSTPPGLPDPDTVFDGARSRDPRRYIITTFPEYYPIFSEPEFTWNKIRQPNRNSLLEMGIGVDGLKTGHTEEAGYGDGGLDDR